MTPASDFDVVIVGAGLFGAATAFHARKLGLRTALLERGSVGAQSSGANFGSLRLQGRAPRQYPLSLRAQTQWSRFSELFGDDCEYDRSGHVYFARDEAGCERLLGYARASEEAGLTIEILEGRALSQRFPLFSSAVRLASYSARCATANPRLATPAICRAFVRAGGHLRSGCAVADIDVTGEGFALTTSHGQRFACASLVNAAGAWAGHIANRFGEPVPLFGAGPPQFVTEPLPYIIRPTLQAIEGDVILRQIPRGNFVFAGYPRTRANADGNFTYVPPAKLVAGMRKIAQTMPALAGIEMIRCWSGVEGYLPDMLPVIGPSATTRGLYHAFGASGGGFQIGPAVGESLADMIAGREPPCCLDPYAITRFAGRPEVSEKIAREFDA